MNRRRLSASDRVGGIGLRPPGRGPDPMIAANRSDYRTLVVDQIRTAYLDVGEGRPIVLLHSGEYGASAQLCWEFNIDALAVGGYRVIAPDWLGFGGTDKLFDFGGGRARRVRHMRRFLDVMDIHGGAFIGSSMGGSVLAATAAMRPDVFEASAIVLSSGGGYAPDNAARRTILDYDCTIEGMRRIVSTIFRNRSWAADDDYVGRRHEASIRPGAYEAAAARGSRRRPPPYDPTSGSQTIHPMRV